MSNLAPPSPSARSEIAAGWPTVLAAALAIGVGMMGVGFYSLGLFVTPLQADFGWTRAEVSGAATFQQLGIFLSAPVVGRLADRFGNRTIAIASYIATPLAFLALAETGPSLTAWYALWLLVSLAGCGTTPAIWARVVSLRFDAGRGFALGLMLTGSGIAAILAPALLGPVIAAQGWRTGLHAIAIVIAVIGIPVSLLTGRGERIAATDARKRGGRMEITRKTLQIALIGFLLGVIVAALIVHLVPMLVDRGVPPAQAAGVAAFIGIAVVFARAFVGWLFDRFHAPRVAVLFLTSPVIACVILWLDGPAVPAALLLGLAAGAEVDMLAYFTSRYAALENYGATYGLILGLFSLGAAFGPPLFGWMVDSTGNSDLALACSGVALVGVLVLIATLGAYKTSSR
ncbi:MFS transporter [Novosphingobium guangzhouense]|uniref:MFS transporter n=1 Tax=Novosphingobium guangzhouense TaxID=1850347 RepID=A0A2K2FT35_9SPHN|nr:MFS transporter [Novosphingobium guangzhouense]PNU01936.1 MFS transporter [Novosphingobium guangzhouense]